MAPSRGRGKAKVYPLGNSSPAQSNRHSARTRSQRGATGGLPDVYRDLLAEASGSSSEDGESRRPLKKRKTATTVGTKPKVQTVEASSASSAGSGESDFDFEDVDMDQPAGSSPVTAQAEDDGIADISVAIDSAKTAKQAPLSKRKAATPAEKAHRLMIHKLHILCLVGHCMYVNTWCNDSEVHENLNTFLSKKTRSYLHHNPDFSQFQQNRSFMDGLQQACEAWRGAFRITATGMRRSRWMSPEVETQEPEMDPLDREEFRRAAKELEGSQDMGNQLFCAMLRAVGVEARMVCSLQVLPFGVGPNDKTTLRKDTKKVVYARASGTQSPTTDSNAEDTAMKDSSTVGKVPSARRRIGQPSFASTQSPAASTSKKKRPTRKLTYPIFWIEAFNKSQQTWVPVDPLVTQSVNKAAKLEPPATYEWTQMSYVFAFDANGVTRDVTKRYTKAYNAKTRRLRVEYADPNGTTWLRRSLRIFRRPRSDEGGRDRDQIEDSQLAKREAQEGLPTNVQDFKHHPYYALERHLRRHEVIQPRREVGKVNAGTSAKPRMEAVFRRSDVQACNTAEKWFRVGREVKEGEQPLKRVPARRARRARAASDDEEGGEAELAALYAPFQTEVYVPPPVVKGKIPRNAYGNLDIYVPSMVPAGGAHIRHPLAKEAARIVRIDAVDAVTGFKFQGRQGTAIVEGVVVPREYKDAVEATIEGLQDDQTEQEGMKRSLLALKMWRRFLTGLRIRERVSAYGNGSGEVKEDEVMTEGDDANEAGGGFTAEDASMQDEQNLPTAGKFSLAELLDVTPSKPAKAGPKRWKESDESEDAESSNDASEANDEGGFERAEPTQRPRRLRNRVIQEDSGDEHPSNVETDVPSMQDVGDDEGGRFLPENGEGGFITEDLDGEGGGFVPVAHNEAHDQGGGVMMDVEEGPTEPLHDASVSHNEDQETHHSPTDGEASEADEDTSMQDDAAAPKLPVPSASPNTFAAEMSTLPDGTESQPEQINEPKPNIFAPKQMESSQGAVPERQNHEHGANVDGYSNDSDRGSMLSHDPEDEDAEPDWLASD